MVSMQYEIIVKSWLWTVYTECMEYWDMIRRFNSVIQNQNVALNTRHQKTTVDFIWLWYFKSACTGTKIISEINSVSNSYVYFLRKLLSIVINMVFIKYNIYFKAIKYSMITLVLSFFKCLVEINFFALLSFNKKLIQTIQLTIDKQLWFLKTLYSLHHFPQVSTNGAFPQQIQTESVKTNLYLTLA